MVVVNKAQQNVSGISSVAWSRDFLKDFAIADPGAVDGIRYVTHLLELGQSICGQTQDGIHRLSREIEQITAGKVSLHLGQRRGYKDTLYGSPVSFSLPVQFNHLVYGYLAVACDPLQPEQPAISAPIAQLLGRVCAYLLYTLEQSAFVQGQCRQLNYQVNGPLTKREREVLALMCNGHDQQSIAALLCISPATVGKHRQHIYSQLGVHSERDALFAAYHAGLFSLIEDSLH